MLPAAHRLTDADSFRRVQRRGRRCASRSLVTHAVLGDPGTPAAAPGRPARVGLVVGKVVGDAVTRNRVKRRLRHLARQRLVDLPPGSTWVVRALPPAAVASSAVLGEDLDACLRRCLSTSSQGSRTGAAR